ncbi:MAG: hypothetical protein JSV49_08055 [Thermoplasmata archaeon]|nr:MAG: hypothetical protein JSV49_08055 [Thermoplasmata archaeon]
MSPSAKRKQQAEADKKNLYIPLYKIMGKIIKRLKKLELEVPIYKIAWMEVHGNFLEKRHKKFRSEIMDFLQVSNEYRRIYWNIIKLARRKFEVEMIKDGSYAPGIKEYESLKNEIPFAILKRKKTVWIEGYNSYLPKIRERSKKKDKKPRNGKQMYRAVFMELGNVLATLKTQQSESIEYAIKIRKGLELMRNQPDRPWGHWGDSDLDLPQTKSKVNKNDKNVNSAKKDNKRKTKKEQNNKKKSK